MVIDELFAKRGTELFPVDSYDGEMIEEINYEGNTYHFAKQRDIEGETQIVADNTVDEPIISLAVEGNTVQQTYSGTNLFNIDLFKSGESVGYTIDENGTVSFTENEADVRYGVDMTFKAGTYTLSCVSTTACLVGGQLFDDGVAYGWMGSGTPSKSFTFTTEKTRTIYIVKTTGATAGTISNIQINKGTTVQPYEPYVGGTASPNPELPQPIHNANDTRLPSEYQEVTYIESTGTQYIDTGVIPNNETGFSIDVSFPDVSTDMFRFGCRKDSGATRFIMGTATSHLYFGYGVTINNDKWAINKNEFYNAKLNFLNSRVANLNDKNDVALGNLGVDDMVYSIIMFGRNSGGSITSSAQTIKACKISQGTSIIRDFIPCYRKSDNVVGMYDIVNGVFYTNAGTGTFLKGENVYEGMSLELRGKNLLDYTKAKATQNSKVNFIDNGMVVTKSTYNYGTTVRLGDISIEENTKYCFSIDCAFINSIETDLRPNEVLIYLNGSDIGLSQKLIGVVKLGTHTEFQTVKFSATTLTGYKNLSIRFYGNVNGTCPPDGYQAILKNIMMSKGDYAPYEPYFTTTTIAIPPSVTVGSSTIPLRFARVEDKADYIEVNRLDGTVKYVRNIAYGKFPHANSVYTSYKGVYVSAFAEEVLNKPKGICTHTDKVGNYADISGKKTAIWVGVNTAVVYWIGILNTLGFWSLPTNEEKLSAFNAWLDEQEANGTPVELIYQLKTPVTRNITNTDLGQELLALATHKGTNIFTISSEIPVSKTALSYWRQIIPNE